jgi:hypothetical protein
MESSGPFEFGEVCDTGQICADPLDTSPKPKNCCWKKRLRLTPGHKSRQRRVPLADHCIGQRHARILRAATHDTCKGKKEQLCVL